MLSSEDILLWSDLVFSIWFAICARVEIFCHFVSKITSEDLFLFDFLIINHLRNSISILLCSGRGINDGDGREKSTITAVDANGSGPTCSSGAGISSNSSGGSSSSSSSSQGSSGTSSFSDGDGDGMKTYLRV